MIPRVHRVVPASVPLSTTTPAPSSAGSLLKLNVKTETKVDAPTVTQYSR